MKKNARLAAPSGAIIAIIVGSLSASAEAAPAKSVEVVNTPEVQSPYSQYETSYSANSQVRVEFDPVPYGQTLFITDVSLKTTARAYDEYSTFRECKLETRDASGSVVFIRYIPFGDQIDFPNLGYESHVLADASVFVFASAGETIEINCLWLDAGRGSSVSASISGYTVASQ